MPSKRYEIWLSQTAFIVVDIVMAAGRVVSFCVRLMILGVDKERNIARYDTAHGIAHRDILDRRGSVVQKVWFPDQPLEAVLNQALDDFKLHYQEYEETWQSK